MRRAAVVVLAALMVAGCSGEPPLRRGFASDETTTTTVTTTAKPSGRVEIRVADNKPAPGPAPEKFVLPAAALTADGLEVQESAGSIGAPLLTLCGNQVEIGDSVRRHRVVTKSTSGASRFEQEIAVHPRGGVSTFERATCPGAEKMTLPGEDRAGWCEPRGGGRGACNVLIGVEDAVVSLKLETISVDRAREVITRLAAAVPLR